MKRLFWIAIAVLSAVYIFIPEFTDVIPIIGWLDEATALGVLAYALKQLNINIFDKFFGKKDKKTIVVDKNN